MQMRMPMPIDKIRKHRHDALEEGLRRAAKEIGLAISTLSGREEDENDSIDISSCIASSERMLRHTADLIAAEEQHYFTSMLQKAISDRGETHH